MLAILVQTKTGTSNLSSTIITFDNNTIPGNSIIVVDGNSSATSGDVSGVTDTQGNIYTKVVTAANATVGEIEIWYTSGIIGGANTVTIAYTTGVACAAIIREYNGLLYANSFDKQTSNTGNSNSLSSGNTTALAQNSELLIGAGLIPLANTFSAGGNFVNLVSVGAPLVVNVAAEDLLVTTGGVQAATFTANGSIQWVCAIATFFLLSTGTTTSTSSTSTSSTSVSSTSSSTSSTSYSISISSTSSSSTSSSTSSTSLSISTSSTSSSISSTSSSVSSTSSSTSSTSVSSTSASTSISSTSTSISSTSYSSTSVSSTSSSTSVSSTSSSVSSTSSSISSTSSSYSSTSVSSTSSSTSNSTTTVLDNKTYSFEDVFTGNVISLIQQSTGSTASGGNTSATVTATKANSLIIVGVANSQSTQQVTSVSDTLNTYNLIGAGKQLGGGGAGFVTLWYAFSTTAGATTITANITGTSATAMVVAEYSGFGTSDPLDKSSYTAGAVAAVTAGPTLPPNVQNELVIGFAGSDFGNNTYTRGNDFGNLKTVGNINMDGAMEDRIATILTSQTMKLTMGNASDNASVVATFKPQPGLPLNASNLLVPFSSSQSSKVSVDDGDYFIEYGSEYMIQEYKKTWVNNTNNIFFTWKGRSTQSSQVSPILIQIYNVSTSNWETLARETRVGADTDFQITVNKTTNPGNYYDSTNTVTFRSYQQVI